MNSKQRFHFPTLENNLLARVFNREPVNRIPIWMMRQAGRCDPQYRRLREKDGRPLEELFLDAEISARISLLPKRFGVDAIIMFQDILTPLAAMGSKFCFVPSPMLKDPIRSLDQVRRLKIPKPHQDLKTVGSVLRNLNAELCGSLPILGFAGAPMTLAFFMIAGQSPSRKIPEILDFILEHPTLTESLLDRLTSVTIDYLNYQIESGAHAVQLFESFADVMPEPVYRRWAQPNHERIFRALDRETPSILFAREFPHLDLLAESGADALSVGHSIDLSVAQKKHPELIFQGNVDNHILADGNKEMINEAIQNCFEKTKGRNHILNLNHGLLERTPFENVLNFVDSAKSLGKAYRNL